MSEKVILPGEIKVCATCAYWDGVRQVDPEMKVVVVESECEGECLVTERQKPGLTDTRGECACIWETLEDDASTNPADASTTDSR